MLARTVIAAAAMVAIGAVASSPAEAHREPLPVGKCINAGNHLEPPTEGQWGSKRLEAEDFARIRDAGFETVRIPVRWYNKSDEQAPHTIDSEWMARVTEVVDQALAADLNVILNSHHFEPLHDNPQENADWLAALWQQIGDQFADRPADRLWFELENEPHNNFTNEILVQVLSPSLAAVRKNNPDRPVIIGGDMWSSVDSLATLDLPDDPNIHPTFHYYEPFGFTHQGASWAGDTPPPKREPYGTAADKERLARDVAALEAYIKRTGLTPFMGETGAYDLQVPLEERIAYHAAVRDAFAPSGVGICAWAYSNTFPFWDDDAQQWLPGLRAAFGLPE